MTDKLECLKQFVLTTAAGKRLIARAMLKHPAIEPVLEKGTLVIVAGTTNGYIAEEVLKATGQMEGFSRLGFCRGNVLAPGSKGSGVPFAGDVVLVDGKWQKGKQIFDVVGDLKCGDVILKGANAFELETGRCAVLIGHPEGGTATAGITAVVGKRATMICPVGVEKRVSVGIDDIAELLNSTVAQGPRMLTLPGRAFCELDAISLLSGASAELAAGGGVLGAEGSAWIAVYGAQEHVDDAQGHIQAVMNEPLCEV